MKKTGFIVLCLILSLSLLASCSRQKGGDDRTSPVSSDSIPTAKVLFKEGYNVTQFADALEEKEVCSAEDFISAVNDIDYSGDFDFLPSNEILSERPYKLEGYLFPDTYEFYINDDAEKVVRRLLRTFESKVYDPLSQYIGQNGLESFDETLTLAAIVERETPSPEEMPKISSVFLNRLKSPDYPKLQSDATKWYPYPTRASIPEELKDSFEGEYDTYIVNGLPKGPVCCPSLSAIKYSFLNDKNEKSYYFYTDKNKKHYYAVTYSEHRKNIKYCQDNGLAG